MKSNAPGISIIIPVKDEAGCIIPLAAEIATVMEKLPRDWECIWIDDGSTDRTPIIISGLAKADPRHRLISFERNAGKSAAYYVGFDEARGELIVTLDGDGQNDPADIPGLLQMVESGTADMASGYRLRRKDGPARKLVSLIANGFRTLITGKTPVRDVGCGIRVFRKECVASLPRFSGMHRFLPTLFSIQGFALAEAPVHHRPRLTGKSKYSINNRLWVGLFDTFGVFWLRKRAFQYEIRRSKDGIDS
jgi:dolichol-phosphate mannosyltransferase